jgi:hypothetical protein
MSRWLRRALCQTLRAAGQTKKRWWRSSGVFGHLGHEGDWMIVLRWRLDLVLRWLRWKSHPKILILPGRREPQMCVVMASCWLSWRVSYAAFVENLAPLSMVRWSLPSDKCTSCNKDIREASSAAATVVSLFLRPWFSPTSKISQTKALGERWWEKIAGWVLAKGSGKIHLSSQKKVFFSLII